MSKRAFISKLERAFDGRAQVMDVRFKPTDGGSKVLLGIKILPRGEAADVLYRKKIDAEFGLIQLADDIADEISTSRGLTRPSIETINLPPKEVPDE